MKRLLLASLLITLSFLNMGFIGKPKLGVVACSKNLNKMSIKEKWLQTWVYDKKTGKQYEYDDFLNEINPLIELEDMGDTFTYKARIENNILKIVESEKNGRWADVRYLIDLKAMQSSSFSLNSPDKKRVIPCEN